MKEKQIKSGRGQAAKKPRNAKAKAPELINTARAAEILGLGYDVVEGAVRRGDIESIEYEGSGGKRRALLTRASVDRYRENLAAKFSQLADALAAKRPRGKKQQQ